MNPLKSPVEALPMSPEMYKHLENPRTPWNLHEDLFERVRDAEWTTPDRTFKSCEVLPSDPEYAFVQEYFNQQRPPGSCITKITCNHNPAHTTAFEAEIKNIEAEAIKFPPKGKEEEPKEARALTIQRWKRLVEPLSPIRIKTPKRTDTFEHTKVLPLWHGTSRAKGASVCSSGFTFFGKHHFFGPGAKAGQASTDIGYFGSGIYFTNSAAYAALYSEGILLLSWVSMREPYPVVSDAPHPTKCTDMKKLEGKGAYQSYNAHYIPIISLVSDDPYNMEYHPCLPHETAAWDEIVVFQKSQTLPRFSIEFGTDMPPPVPPAPKTLLQTQATIEDLVEHFSSLLETPTVQQDPQMVSALTDKVKSLVLINPQTPLIAKDQELYHCSKSLISRAGKIQAIVKEQFLEMLPPLVKQKPVQAVAQKAPLFPPQAFGKAKWFQYFGEIGEEPPFPPDIHQILQSECPVWPGKTIQETHMLVLIPKTVNGAPFTLDALGELIQRPKQGPATKYDYYWDEAKKALGNQSPPKSYWILMTKDVLPDSRSKSYDDQRKIVQNCGQKARAAYQVPTALESATSILLEHVQSGTRLYTNEPCTYTRCQEKVAGYQMAVGGFGPGGLDVSYSNDDYDYVGVSCVRKF